MPLPLKVAKPITGALAVKAKPNHSVMAPIKAAHFPRWHLPPLKIKQCISAAAKSPLTNLFAMVHTANCKNDKYLGMQKRGRVRRPFFGLSNRENKSARHKKSPHVCELNFIGAGEETRTLTT